MIKILMFGMSTNKGGVESYIYNLLKNIDKSKFYFDIICNFLDKCAYEDEIKALGFNVYHFIPRSKNPLLFNEQIKKFFKNNNDYDIYYQNSCVITNLMYMKYAKKYHFKKIILHAHNSYNTDGYIKGKLHNYNKNKIDNYVTDKWACSDSAGRFFFNDSYQIINNAIELSKYQFNPYFRNKIRTKYNVSRETLIINIGRFHFQKNQLFILEIFKKYLEINRNAKLMLVGDGEDREIIENRINELAIKEKVILTGMVNNVEDYLSAGDVLVFPSIFEGLSIALLEAQANGIPSLVNKDVIEKKAIINTNFITCSLKEKEKWVKYIDALSYIPRANSEISHELFKEKGYAIDSYIKTIEQLLMKGISC